MTVHLIYIQEQNFNLKLLFSITWQAFEEPVLSIGQILSMTAS